MSPETEPTTVALNEARDKLLEHWENVVILVSRREDGFTKYNARRFGNDFALCKHAEIFAAEIAREFMEDDKD